MIAFNIVIMEIVMKKDITLKDDERQCCEVWTRVMGYHRPVSYFNIGKKGEHEERVHFNEPELTDNCCNSDCSCIK
jgi:hypothetical protein